jgi:hypothetical protein
MADVYNRYVKQTESRRFSITGWRIIDNR